MKKLKQLLKNSNTDNILDVCTGVGQFIDVVKSSVNGYSSIIGVDSLERVINMARESNEDSHVSFQLMDCYDLGFKDKLFDLVSIANSLHHLSDVEKVFEEIKRVSSDDAHILVCEMFKDNQTPMQMSHVKFHHWSADIGTRMGTVHKETYTREEIKSMILSNNLEIVYEFDHIFDYEDSESSRKQLCETVDKILKDVHDNICTNEDYPKIVQEGDKIKEYILENGFQHATSYIALCRKK